MKQLMPQTGQQTWTVVAAGPATTYDNWSTHPTMAVRQQVWPHQPHGGGRTIARRLRECGIDHLRIGEALAVLGEAASAETVARLLSLEAHHVNRVVAELDTAGLVDGYRFRDADAGTVLLRGLRMDVRRRLHHRAAEVLHACDAAPGAIADHLVRSGYPRHSWMPAVLRAGAAEALALDRIDHAMNCLELAYRASADTGERAEIAAVLASIEWRVNPSPATRNFARLHTAVRAGTLAPASLHGAVRYLLWHGRADDALAACDVLDSHSRSETHEFAPALTFLRAWIAYTYPELAARRGAGPTAVCEAGQADSVHLLATHLLAEITGDPGSDATVALAHRILSRHRLDSSTVEALTTALEALIYAGKLDVAAAWCDALLAEATARTSPTWQALFAGLRAEIALRQGLLTEAADFAVRALNLVPAENQGMVVARPLSCHVLALTEMGRHRDAETQLGRDVPLGLFDSRLVLPYLQARGRLALATSRVEDALLDFELCGALTRRWNLDLPGLVPWRNELARAYLVSGDPRQARTCAEQHLSRLGDAHRHGSGGVSLRLIAATATPGNRLALLQRSEAIATGGDDRLELATVRADLGIAYESAGKPDRAQTARRSALRLAEVSGAQPLYRRLCGEPTAPPEAPDTDAAIAALSEAERRVAGLAAQGLRNRDIALRLEITTSTVEQHLTRVYRKLKARRRTELRFMLGEQRQ